MDVVGGALVFGVDVYIDMNIWVLWKMRVYDYCVICYYYVFVLLLGPGVMLVDGGGNVVKYIDDGGGAWVIIFEC